MMLCLYCGDTPSDPTREHVILAGLSGTLTLTREVCGDCNTAFSAIDKELIGFLERVRGADVKSVFAGGNFLMKHGESGPWLSVRLDSSFRPFIFPQIVLSSDLSSGLLATCDESVGAKGVDQLRELEQPGIELRDWIQSAEGFDPPVTPALVRSARNVFAIRASSNDEATRVRRKMQRGLRIDGLSFDGIAALYQPQWTGSIALKMSDVGRCLCKMSLNLLCYLSGLSEATQARFDGVRRLARFSEGDVDDTIVPLQSEAKNLGFLAQPAHHTGAILSGPDGNVYCFWSFHGQPHAMVRLGPRPSAMPPVMGIVDVDYRNRNTVVYTMDDPRALVRRCSEAEVR